MKTQEELTDLLTRCYNDISELQDALQSMMADRNRLENRVFALEKERIQIRKSFMEGKYDVLQKYFEMEH